MVLSQEALSLTEVASKHEDDELIRGLVAAALTAQQEMPDILVV